jgi:hypothetical protein
LYNFKKMQLNDVSKYFLQYFEKKSCVHPVSFSRSVFHFLQTEINKAQMFLETRMIMQNLSVTVQQMHREEDIIKPVKDHVPKEFWVRIKEYSKNIIRFETRLEEKIVELIFIVEDKKVKEILDVYFVYAKQALIWLQIALTFASRECLSLEKISVYFYFNPFMKLLPQNSRDPLGEMHANTAYTYACPRDVSEIVVFRKEDWFKTFIHETFHNFGFDFSSSPDMSSINNKILNTFHVKSDVRLYEAYTEFWATVINVSFCAYNKNNYERECVYLLNMEREFSLFQLVKTLDHFHLSFRDLLKKGKAYDLYKEKTSVLAYFIIKCIMLQSFHEFISWCQQHNGRPIFQFRSTEKNQESFANFIVKESMSRALLESIECTESFYKEKKRENKDPFILQSFKMVICEMG